MNKKIIALILILPLAALYLLFSVSATAALQIDIPVTSIQITNRLDERTAFFELATYENDFFLEVTVLPTKAKNRAYNVSVTPVDTVSEFATIEVNAQSGLVAPKSTGKARITVKSHDGGFTDSIIAVVTTEKPLSMSLFLDDSLGNSLTLTPSLIDGVDYGANVTTGRYVFRAETYPVSSSTAFSSSDSNKAKINSFSGRAELVSSGAVTITAVSDGAFGALIQKILLNVTPRQTNSGITVNGEENRNFLLAKSSLNARFIVEARQEIDQTPVLSGADIAAVTSYTFNKIADSAAATNKYELLINFSPIMPFNMPLNAVLETEPQLELQIVIDTARSTFFVTFGDYIFELFETKAHNRVDGAFIQRAGRILDYFVLSTPEQENVDFDWICDNYSVISIQTHNDSAKITALSEGIANVTVAPSAGGLPIGGAFSFQIKVVSNITNIEFAINTKQWGSTLNPAFADKKIGLGGNYVENANQILLNVFVGKTSVAVDLTQFEFSTSNADIATISTSGAMPALMLESDGYVTLKARWKYENPNETPVRSESSVESVKDGVSVGTYEHLIKATEDSRKIVLNADIMLGKRGATLSELNAMTKELPTTYSWKYHENKGGTQPSVRYAVEFKNDIHGNGYFINGEYITMAADNVGTPLLYKGPLDFVEMEGFAKAKAQDNITFLVRTDGVLIDNVVLTGCSDSAIEDSDSGTIDLEKLRRTGTVLEIAANVNVLNCRIRNGRNVIRAYGGNKFTSSAIVNNQNDVDVEKERIAIRIDGCVLSQAREFIIKAGTNNAVLGTAQNNAPKLKVNGVEIDNTNKNLYKNAAFYQQCVLTDITLRNSALLRSGLFAVGIDSYYSGPVFSGQLDGKFGQTSNLFDPWINAGGTSFATILKLEGDVRFYDWKALSTVDSSTLIETVGIAEDILNIDVTKIINSAISVKGGDFENIITRDDTEYINTAIMMFGGGRNYSQIVFDNFENENLSQYGINVDVLTKTDDSVLQEQGQLVPAVIGREDFLFYMYNRNSQSSLARQREDFASGTAYDGIKIASRQF